MELTNGWNRCSVAVQVRSARKGVAEANTNQAPSREVVASCPKCGEPRIHAQKIVSVTELIDFALSATA